MPARTPRGRSPLFLRYFLYYSAAVLLLLSLLGLLLNRLVIGAFLQNTEKEYRAILYSKMEQLDENLLALQATALQVEMMPRSSPYLVCFSPVDRMDMIKSLKAMQSTNPILKDIAIWYARQPDRLVSTSGSTLPATFIASFPRESWSGERLLREMQNLRGVALFLIPSPSGEDPRFLLLAPIPGGAAPGYACALFLVDGAHTLRPLQTNISQFDGFLYVSDAEHNAAFQHWGASTRNLSARDLDDPRSLERSYLLLSGTAGYGLTYTIGIHRGHLNANVARVWHICLALLLCASVLGLAASLFIAEKIYRPIRQIGRIAGFQPEQHRTELDQFSRSLDQLLEEQRRTEGAIGDMRRQLLENLLLQPEPDVQSAGELMRFTQLRTPYPRFCVIRLQSMDGSPLPHEALRPRIEALAATHPCALLHIRKSSADALHLVVNVAAEKEEAVAQALEALPGTEGCYLSIGSLVDSPFALNQSYQSANRAAGSGLLRPACRGVSASQAQAAQAAGGAVYPEAEEKQLLHVFLSADPAQAVPIAQRIVQKLEDANLGQPLQRSIYISILHALQHTLSCARILSERCGGYIHNFLLRTEAEAAQTGGQFISLIALLSGELQNRAVDETPLIQRGIAYIQKHYASYELSLGTVAEHVGLSPSYLTRLFREATGHSVKETIDQIRMRHARELLEQTDLSVSRIAEQVGHLSIDSFSRKFKAIEGVAPNQYRALARTKNG